VSNFIIYEHPLNERIRLFLRFEYFYTEALYFKNAASFWEAHASIKAFLEILTLNDRQDVRSEITKEIERQIGVLTRLSQVPNIDTSRLENTLEKLQDISQKLYKPIIKFNPIIRDSELLQTIRQRSALAGGATEIDLPCYRYWLNLSSAHKSEQISQWLKIFTDLFKAVDLLLTLLRESAVFSLQAASKGIFQKSLELHNPAQLIRVKLKNEYGVYPEISAGKHRVNIRFLHGRDQGRALPAIKDFDFDLSCCAI